MISNAASQPAPNTVRGRSLQNHSRGNSASHVHSFNPSCAILPFFLSLLCAPNPFSAADRACVRCVGSPCDHMQRVCWEPPSSREGSDGRWPAIAAGVLLLTAFPPRMAMAPNLKTSLGSTRTVIIAALLASSISSCPSRLCYHHETILLLRLSSITTLLLRVKQQRRHQRDKVDTIAARARSKSRRCSDAMLKRRYV